MTAIYLAAAFNRQDEMRAYRDQIRSFGYHVTSRWIDQTDDDPMAAPEVNPELAYRMAERDIMDILLSDTFVLFTNGPSTTGGRHTELGFALAIKINIIVIGRRENVFQHWPGTEQFDKFQDALYYIRSTNAATRGTTVNV